MNYTGFDEVLYGLTLVRDGAPRSSTGNFIGFYGIPQQGGWYYYAENGDHGEAVSEAECREEIAPARERG